MNPSNSLMHFVSAQLHFEQSFIRPKQCLCVKRRNLDYVCPNVRCADEWCADEWSGRLVERTIIFCIKTSCLLQLYSCTVLYSSCSDPLHETKLYTLDLASLTTTMRAILLLAIAGLVAARRGAKPCEYEKPAQLSTVRAFR